MSDTISSMAKQLTPQERELLSPLEVSDVPDHSETEIAARSDTGIGSKAYAEFLSLWESAVENPYGLPVLSKRLDLDVARMMLEKAVEVLRSEFDPRQLPFLMQDNRLTMRAYMETLVSIRDDSGLKPKDRMAAADKIQQVLMAFLRSYSEQQNMPGQALQETFTPSKDQNILGVMVNVAAPARTAQREVVSVANTQEALSATSNFQLPETTTGQVIDSTTGEIFVQGGMAHGND